MRNFAIRDAGREVVIRQNLLEKITIGRAGFTLRGEPDMHYAVKVTMTGEGLFSFNLNTPTLRLFMDWFYECRLAFLETFDAENYETVLAVSNVVPAVAVPPSQSAVELEIFKALDTVAAAAFRADGAVELRQAAKQIVGAIRSMIPAPAPVKWPRERELPPTALECLRDVISHHGDIKKALEASMAIAESADEKHWQEMAKDGQPLDVTELHANGSYWKHQLDVWERMLGQAVFAVQQHDNAVRK